VPLKGTGNGIVKKKKKKFRKAKSGVKSKARLVIKFERCILGVFDIYMCVKKSVKIYVIMFEMWKLCLVGLPNGPKNLRNGIVKK